LEELIVNAIKSDTQAQHHVRWKEKGHDDEADMKICTNGDEHPVQIKSGQIQGEHLVLSGHRLGRFEADMELITDYLSEKVANIISVPYHTKESDEGRIHVYQVLYIDVHYLADVREELWEFSGTSWKQENQHGVNFSIRPKMSWQIWWHVPLHLTEATEPFEIGL